MDQGRARPTDADLVTRTTHLGPAQLVVDDELAISRLDPHPMVEASGGPHSRRRPGPGATGGGARPAIPATPGAADGRLREGRDPRPAGVGCSARDRLEFPDIWETVVDLLPFFFFAGLLLVELRIVPDPGGDPRRRDQPVTGTRPYGEQVMVLIVSAQGCGFRSSEALKIGTPIMLATCPAEAA